MSVYIRGMEMPDSCHECACFVHKYDSGWYDYDVCKAAEMVFNDGYSSVTVHIDPFKERLDNCPLVPVPKHGRLIDADALENTLGAEDRDIYVHWTIESSPTIIPAEEVQDND